MAASNGVSAADSIQKGLVTPGGKLAKVLQGIEAEAAKRPLRSKLEALAIVQDATSI